MEKKSINLPKHTNYVLKYTGTEQSIRDIDTAITVLKSLGVPVWRETTEFDPAYPHLKWCPDQKHLTQSRNSGPDYGKVITESLSEFLSYFFKEEEKTVKISDQYTAVICDSYVQVGCQRIPFDTVKEIYELTINK